MISGGCRFDLACRGLPTSEKATRPKFNRHPIVKDAACLDEISKTRCSAAIHGAQNHETSLSRADNRNSHFYFPSHLCKNPWAQLNLDVNPAQESLSRHPSRAWPHVMTAPSSQSSPNSLLHQHWTLPDPRGETMAIGRNFEKPAGVSRVTKPG